MRVGLAQVNFTVGDLDGNIESIATVARSAVERGADLVVFSELSIPGYPPRDLLEKPSFIESGERALMELAARTEDLDAAIICGGVSRLRSQPRERLFNCAMVLARGEVAFRQPKMLLPTYDVFDETRYFAPAERQEICTVHERRVALAICEDVWNDKHAPSEQLFQRDPVEEMLAVGADIIVSINASPYSIGRREQRRSLVRATAKRYCRPVVYVNQVGGNDQLVFDGSSFAINAGGAVIASAHSFKEDLVIADFDAGIGDCRQDLADEPEAVYDALVLGTRDYVRKNGFAKVIVGLSGGIDSSLTAVIAVEAVGRDNVVGLAMPGPYSSDQSGRAADTLARNLGIRLESISIAETYTRFLEALAPVLPKATRPITEENLQARLRGLALMAVSNDTGALVLSTGNKSELAVGYCTLYGDMCGALAVIGDACKTMVYTLSRIANRRNSNAIPESILSRPPSAELRPNQQDTDSLPEYEVLDRILEAYVENNQSARAISTDLGLPLELVREIAGRVNRSEYKRQQAPPGLRVTKKAFGIGRRCAIAQAYVE